MVIAQGLQENGECKMTELMPVKNIQDIRDLNPCYDPVTGLDSCCERHNDGYLPEDWQGTALDILNMVGIPCRDLLWVVCHEGWLNSDKIWRLWAAECARQALSLIKNPKLVSVHVCDVTERFSQGNATIEELNAAWNIVMDVGLVSVGISVGNSVAKLAARVANDAIQVVSDSMMFNKSVDDWYDKWFDTAQVMKFLRDMKDAQFEQLKHLIESEL